MATRTALRHIENAIRNRLGIRAGHAHAIVDRRPLDTRIDDLMRDMKGSVALVSDDRKSINVYAPDDNGHHAFACSLDLFPEDVTRWERMTITQAYALPGGIVFADEQPRRAA